MAIYNLEESPDVYIVPRYYNNRFVYQMAVVTGEMNRRVIHTIDLRNDKVMVYGTEIKQSVLERLHQSLVLRPKQGVIYVNCNGACYFLIPAKGCYRPIHNAIFDWSQFGVVVPNTLNDSLRKELEVMEQLLSSAKAEAFIAEASLEASMKEVEELKEQLSTYENEKQDREENMEQLELLKKRVMELEKQLSISREESRNREVELRKVQDQLSSADSELEYAKKQLELSTMSLKELETRLSSCRKEKEEIEMTLQKVQDELSSAHFELDSSSKAQLESSKKITKEFEEQLSASEKENQNMKAEFQKLQDQLLAARHELESTKAQLESSQNQVQELESQSCTCKKDHQDMELELKKMLDHLLSIDVGVKSSNQKLDQLLNSMLWNELPNSTTDLPIFASVEEDDQQVPNEKGVDTS